jgi:drug/metabolite transporter (DMT)-like permease
LSAHGARHEAIRNGIGVLLVIAAAVGFSVRGILVKLAYPYGVDAVTLMTLRMVFSLPFFVLMGWFAHAGGRRFERSDWMLLLALGFIGYYLSSLLSFLGLLFVPASLERLLLYITPTLVVLLSALVFRQRVQRRHVAALVMTYSGIVLVMGDSLMLSAEPQPLAIGALLVFCSALTYAVYLIGSGTVIPRLGSMRFTAYASGTACLFVIAHFALVRDFAALDLPLPVYGYGFAMALISTVLPTWMMAEGIGRIGANRASIVSSVGPVSTIVLAFLVLGEAITLVQIGGAGLVLAGVVVVSTKGGKAMTPAALPAR